MADSNGANDDLKAKMREALDRKKGNDPGVPQDGPVKEKAHGSEVDRWHRPEDAPAQGRWRRLLSPREQPHASAGCRRVRGFGTIGRMPWPAVCRPPRRW